MSKIPFVDLNAQYLGIQKEIDIAIQCVIRDSAFAGGKYVADFELDFAAFLGVDHVVSCANGTDSIEILLKSMGISEGDEVIVPAISWISTSEAVSTVGGVPVFVDVDEDLLIDISKIESKISPKTKAIIPVHLYGNPVDMPSLMQIAKKHGLKVLEDCAQSHGATFKGKLTGTFGDCASFSFYPGKNLGAYGDAGCMVTNDPDIANRARVIANHGQIEKNNHIMEGRNSRMDGLQAAVLSVKLKHLNNWTEARIRNANFYREYLIDAISRPRTLDSKKHVYHLFVIEHPKRDDLALFLSEQGVGTGIHYPSPLPFLPFYRRQIKNAEKEYKVALEKTSKIISLPMYAELHEENIAFVANLVNGF